MSVVSRIGRLLETAATKLLPVPKIHTFKAPSGIVELHPGTSVYHTTSHQFTQFKKRPTWFTPFPKEVIGYHTGPEDRTVHAR